MINFIKGCKIENAEELKEEYNIVDNNGIIDNVNAEKIIKLIYDFIDMQGKDAHLFLFLETPKKENEEHIIKEATDNSIGIIKETGNNVYYMDDVPQIVFKDILKPVEDVLVNDGFTSFGVGNHENGDEIGKYPYNEVYLYSKDNILKYEKLFNNYNIHKNSEMIYAEDIINVNNLGVCELYQSKNGTNIYDVVESFKECFEEFYKEEE